MEIKPITYWTHPRVCTLYAWAYNVGLRDAEKQLTELYRSGMPFRYVKWGALDSAIRYRQSYRNSFGFISYLFLSKERCS